MFNGETVCNIEIGKKEKFILFSQDIKDLG
jgi:hypothetical protein